MDEIHPFVTLTWLDLNTKLHRSPKSQNRRIIGNVLEGGETLAQGAQKLWLPLEVSKARLDGAWSNLG
ncbi:hypothetical protein HGM15179_004522 [Zosterops borbonicus]|uniref:Uncharacterized protein n=1 Tax=Zosterops borbonicus TaxID=364589 RepID=A0A8K1GR03_9PASS|nr:hypothetical protein HGM15179_004522 [Zosterops borbonicus]